MNSYRNPVPTVDGIIQYPSGVLLIHRKNPPSGWALPGGFIDYGEDAETAVLREIKEETGIDAELVELFHVYSDPSRDPRQHTLSVVFILKPKPGSVPIAGDDAGNLDFFTEDRLPDQIAFDHRKILESYFHYKKTGASPNKY
ncbi:MAG: NUDIX hydrolase [bacterium]|nr:NUDIX hydrolase [bacterium]